MDEKVIPDIIVGRLPIYLLALQHMLREGRQVTSSQELGERLGISSAQIRKDLSQFGEFGKQGTGYKISYLADQIKKILKLNQVWDIVLIGAGDIGRAIVGHQGLLNRGFRIVRIFDKDPVRIGQQLGELVVENVADLEEKIENNPVRVAILAVPATEAQAVAERLVKAGIRAILNYAPITLHLPVDVRIENFDPLIHLQKMTYYL